MLRAGKRVRIAKRTRTDIPADYEVVLGDAADASFCVDAARGAAAIYHCMNPPYSTKVWADLVPRYMGNVIAAAGKAGARLVVLDNLYMLGRPNGRPLDDDTPMNPCSRKGEIRARAAERLFDAHRRGDVIATAGRASDFYGPGGTLTGLGDFFWPRALAGKTAYSPYPLDAVHTYHYIPDVAAGLATRVRGPRCLRPAMDVAVRACGFDAGPCRASGTHTRTRTSVGQLPRWILKAMAIVMPLMRELDEMLYQWDEPFVVDDRRFRERFHVVPENIDMTAAATVAWARQHYSRSA